MGPPPTARGWGAQARALALLSSRAEQEQAVAVQKSPQADVRQAGGEGRALSEKRDSARAELQKALRGQRAALDRLRVKLERLARGDASLASHARNHASDEADDEMGLKRFDADLSRFRAGQRAEFERLRADERAVSRELAKAAARFAAWDGDDPDGVPPPPAAPGDAPPPPPPDARPEATRDVAGELRRVDARLAAGGPTGGWPADEHAVFLEAWAPAAARLGAAPDAAAVAAAAAAAHAATGGALRRTAAEVAAHARWHLRRAALLARRRRLVAAWRGGRDGDAAEVVACVEINSGLGYHCGDLRAPPRYRADAIHGDDDAWGA